MNLSSLYKLSRVCFLLIALLILFNTVDAIVDGLHFIPLGVSSVVVLVLFFLSQTLLRFAFKLEQINKVVFEASRGNFEGRITHIALGDITSEIAWSTNTLLDQLETLFGFYGRLHHQSG